MIEDFEWRLRVRGSGRDGASVFARKHRFDTGAPLSFDPEYGRVTALEYALGALGSELVTGMQQAADRQRVKIDNIEAAVSGRLNNPLTYLGVVGEEGHPGLEKVVVTVFVSTSSPEESVRRVWEETLRKSPLVQTLKDALKLELELKTSI